MKCYCGLHHCTCERRCFPDSFSLEAARKHKPENECKSECKLHLDSDCPCTEKKPLPKTGGIFDEFKGPKGDKGDKGDTGAVGPVGPQGETGPQGLRGPQGEKGDKGDTGLQGPQGERGERGEKGDKGDRGDRGMIGPQGDRGDVGPAGPEGPVGPRGEKGEKGDQGPQGIQGIQGPKGDTGERGPKGDTGERGEKGDRGDKGDTGDRGERGPQGERGEKGDRGDVGPQGLKGDRGEVGPVGPQGPKGDKGDAGGIEDAFLDNNLLKINLLDGRKISVDLSSLRTLDTFIANAEFTGGVLRLTNEQGGGTVEVDLGNLEAITTVDSDTIRLIGDGTANHPLRAEIKLADSEEILVINKFGLAINRAKLIDAMINDRDSVDVLVEALKGKLLEDIKRELTATFIEDHKASILDLISSSSEAYTSDLTSDEITFPIRRKAD